MSVTIVKTDNLSEKNLQDVFVLYEISNTVDGSNYSFDKDDDFRKENDINTFLLYNKDVLLSSLHIFAPTLKEAEIIAITTPKERKKGYFNILLKCAKIELVRRKIKTLLFVCDFNSVDGNQMIKHINLKHEYSEFLLRYDSKQIYPLLNKKITIKKAHIMDSNRYIEINSMAFNSTKNESEEIIKEFFSSIRRQLYSICYENLLVGMIGIYEEINKQYIYGFCVDPKFQNKGIGKYALSEVVNIGLNNGKNKIIELEVQTENINALKLYQNVGFKILTEFQYFRSKLEIN